MNYFIVWKTAFDKPVRWLARPAGGDKYLIVRNPDHRATLTREEANERLLVIYNSGAWNIDGGCPHLMEFI